MSWFWELTAVLEERFAVDFATPNVPLAVAVDVAAAAGPSFATAVFAGVAAAAATTFPVLKTGAGILRPKDSVLNAAPFLLFGLSYCLEDLLIRGGACRCRA